MFACFFLLVHFYKEISQDNKSHLSLLNDSTREREIESINTKKEKFQFKNLFYISSKFGVERIDLYVCCIFDCFVSSFVVLFLFIFFGGTLCTSFSTLQLYLCGGVDICVQLAGLCILVVGVWAWNEKDSFRHPSNESSIILDPAFLLICCGTVAFVIGFTGCVGALRENTALLSAVNYSKHVYSDERCRTFSMIVVCILFSVVFVVFDIFAIARMWTWYAIVGCSR